MNDRIAELEAATENLGNMLAQSERLLADARAQVTNAEATAATWTRRATEAERRLAQLEAMQGRLLDVIGLAINYPQEPHVYEQMRSAITEILDGGREQAPSDRAE